jgi:hypothetical protein
MSYLNCARHVPWHEQRINLRKNFQLCHVPKPIGVGTGTLGRHTRRRKLNQSCKEPAILTGDVGL